VRELPTLGCLLLAALALLRQSTPQAATRRLPPPSSQADSPPDRQPGQGGDIGRARAITGACALLALAVALVMPRPFGFAAAPVVFAVGRRLLRLLPRAQERPPPAYLLAACADLLAACLEAGAVPAAALSVTGGSLPDPLGTQVADAGQAIAEGTPMEEALPEAGGLAPLAAVFRRSSHTGSAMAEQLIAVAEQVRADDHFARLERAHRVAILSTLPLGLCMLPAFLLLAVVPAIAGLGAGLLPH
jgi:Flp pilus assembly protein TadB